MLKVLHDYLQKATLNRNGNPGCPYDSTTSNIQWQTPKISMNIHSIVLSATHLIFPTTCNDEGGCDKL